MQRDKIAEQGCSRQEVDTCDRRILTLRQNLSGLIHRFLRGCLQTIVRVGRKRGAKPRNCKFALQILPIIAFEEDHDDATGSQSLTKAAERRQFHQRTISPYADACRAKAAPAQPRRKVLARRQAEAFDE